VKQGKSLDLFDDACQEALHLRNTACSRTRKLQLLWLC